MATDTEENIKMNFREKALLDLNEVKEIYNKLGIKYFLINATLLGAIREKNIILSDHDVDIGLYGEDIHRSVDIYQAFRDAGFSVGGGESLQFPCEEIRRPIWFTALRNVKTEHAFFFKTGNKRITWYTTRKIGETESKECLVWENDAKYFEPLEVGYMKGEGFPIPNHARELLALWYKNWEIPSGLQVWAYKSPRLWIKDFDPLRIICGRCLDSTSLSSSSSSKSSSSKNK